LAHDVFISYASRDKVVADAVCATLESSRVRCWIAPRDVPPGASYAEALIDALNQSRILVLVFSVSSNSSQQVMREVERAVSKGIPIIPLRIEAVTPSKSMEYFISTQHWLDALTPPLEAHLVRLADTIQLLLKREVREPMPPPQRRPGARQTLDARWNQARRVLRVLTLLVVLAVFVGVEFAVGRFASREATQGSLPPTATSGLVSAPTIASAATPRPTSVVASTTASTAGSTPAGGSRLETTPTPTRIPSVTGLPTNTSDLTIVAELDVPREDINGITMVGTDL
jgi:hypothetical protein